MSGSWQPLGEVGWGEAVSCCRGWDWERSTSRGREVREQWRAGTGSELSVAIVIVWRGSGDGGSDRQCVRVSCVCHVLGSTQATVGQVALLTR